MGRRAWLGAGDSAQHNRVRQPCQTMKSQLTIINFWSFLHSKFKTFHRDPSKFFPKIPSSRLSLPPFPLICLYCPCLTSDIPRDPFGSESALPSCRVHKERVEHKATILNFNSTLEMVLLYSLSKEKARLSSFCLLKPIKWYSHYSSWCYIKKKKKAHLCPKHKNPKVPKQGVTALNFEGFS